MITSSGRSRPAVSYSGYYGRTKSSGTPAADGRGPSAGDWRRLYAGAAAVALAIGLSACSGASSAQGSDTGGGRPSYGGTLTSAIPADPHNLDYGINTNGVSVNIDYNIFETLFAPDKNFVVRPMLASGYTVSKDGTVYTITLRHGVKFQNGATMNANDVVASLNRWYTVSGEGQSVAADVASTKASDASTVVITLKQPRYSLISSLAALVQPPIIIPANVATAAGAKVLTNSQIIGTGPYRLSSYVTGQFVELTAFKSYSARTEDWGGFAGKKTAYISNLKFVIVPDSTQRINGLQTGQYQFAVNLDQDQYTALKADNRVAVYVPAQSSLQTYLLNSGSGTFSNVKARQAFNLLIDKRAVAQAMLGPSQLWSPLSGAFAFSDNQPMHSEAGESVYKAHDPTEAKALFQQAGVTSNTVITIQTTQTYSGLYQMAEIAQSELSSIGIKAKLQVYDFPTMISRLTSNPGSWDISMTAFSGEPLNPHQILFLSPTWAGGFHSTKLNNLFAKYDQSTTASQAHAVVDEIQQDVWEEVPDVIVGKLALLDGASPKLRNYSNFDQEYFPNSYLSGS